MSAHTPGPWRWELNEKHHDVRLCGAAGYDLTVLNFVRWGMGSAAPRFRTEVGGAPQVMVRAECFGVVVPGREHHAEWFRDLSHPDAALIAAAPELLEALEQLVADVEQVMHSEDCGRISECDETAGAVEEHEQCGYHSEPCPSCECGVAEWQQHAAHARAAIAKARGGR